MNYLSYPRALNLVSGPTGEPVSLTEAKAHLRITASGDDTYISTLITAARRQAEAFTNRALMTQTWDLYLPRFPLEIVVPYPTLQSVSSITYVDVDGASQTATGTIYTTNIYATPGRITEAYGQSWPSTREQYNAVKVRYVAGYGTASAVPEDIKQSMLLTIGHLYENREDIGEVRLFKTPKAAEYLLTPYRVFTF